jgi:hypothetical protein
VAAFVKVIPPVKFFGAGKKPQNANINHAHWRDQILVVILQEKIDYHEQNKNHRPKISEDAPDFFAPEQ